MMYETKDIKFLKRVRIFAWFITGLFVGTSAASLGLMFTVNPAFMMPGVLSAFVFFQWNKIANMCSERIKQLEADDGQDA